MFLIITFISKPILIIQEQTSIQTAHCLAQPLAQAGRSRSGEMSSLRRDELAQASPTSPRRRLEEHPETNTGSRLGETPLAWARRSLAQKYWTGRLGDLSRKRGWASPCSSRLGETGSLGRDMQVSPLFSCNSDTHHSKQQTYAFQTNIASYQPHKNGNDSQTT